MNFSLTEEQQLLADSLARFIERDYGFEQRNAIVRSTAGYSADAWRTLAELGLLALPLPADYGGFGGGPGDLLPVMTALGKGLVVEPYLATAVLGASAIVLAGTPAQQAAILPAVGEGRHLLAVAHDDAEHHGVTLENGRLAGAKRVVLHGGQADTLVVTAGEKAFLVPRGMAGVAVRDYRTIDGLRAADIVFDGVVPGADAELPGGTLAVRAALDRGIAALCAEAVGVIEQLNALTLDYIRTRQQFGQPIGRFQVLQHRAVDMFIAAEQSKSMAYLAAMEADNADGPVRRQAVEAAAAYVAKAARQVAKDAIQLHGGMGVTHEMAASHYAKRATMIGVWLRSFLR